MPALSSALRTEKEEIRGQDVFIKGRQVNEYASVRIDKLARLGNYDAFLTFSLVQTQFSTQLGLLV